MAAKEKIMTPKKGISVYYGPKRIKRGDRISEEIIKTRNFDPQKFEPFEDFAKESKKENANSKYGKGIYGKAVYTESKTDSVDNE